MEDKNKDRASQILNLIKEAKAITGSKPHEQYEYLCPKCGLILTFNRNQVEVICPNDGRTMRRQK
jgi:hypothetical protein